MKILRTLFLESLAYRLDGEDQVARVLPKLAKAARCTELKTLLERHVIETEEHIRVIHRIFKAFAEPPVLKHSEASAGLVNEAVEVTHFYRGTVASDAALIAAVQMIEHHGICAYGSLHEWAKVLNDLDVATSIQKLLDDEYRLNAQLTSRARIYSNIQAKSAAGQPSELRLVKNLEQTLILEPYGTP